MRLLCSSVLALATTAIVSTAQSTVSSFASEGRMCYVIEVPVTSSTSTTESFFSSGSIVLSSTTAVTTDVSSTSTSTAETTNMIVHPTTSASSSTTTTSIFTSSSTAETTSTSDTTSSVSSTTSSGLTTTSTTDTTTLVISSTTQTSTLLMTTDTTTTTTTTTALPACPTVLDGSFEDVPSADLDAIDGTFGDWTFSGTNAETNRNQDYSYYVTVYATQFAVLQPLSADTEVSITQTLNLPADTYTLTYSYGLITLIDAYCTVSVSYGDIVLDTFIFDDTDGTGDNDKEGGNINTTAEYAMVSTGEPADLVFSATCSYLGADDGKFKFGIDAVSIAFSNGRDCSA